MIEQLIGWRLTKIDNSGFEVEKGGNVKHFVFDEDYGDCCGYNEITTNLLVSEEDLSTNPVITEVEKVDAVKIATRMYEECDRIKITFMG